MRRIYMLAALCGALLMLGGCDIKTGDDLLAPPKPSKNYYALQEELEAIQKKGAVYSAPQSGQNRNNVQLVDLDNDQDDEAIAFFRESANSNQFDIYVFNKIGEEYVCMGSISGSGIAVGGVEYPTFAPTGEKGIMVTWLLPGDQTAMSVYSLSNGRVKELMKTDYSSYVLADMDLDGTEEIIATRKDSNGKLAARLYNCSQGNVEVSAEAPLAPEARSIISMNVGMIGGDMRAVFVEEKSKTGSGVLTDILIFEKEALRNLTLNTESSSEQSTYRPVAVMATDINGDVVTEVPQARLAAGSNGMDPNNAFYILDWYAYSAKNEPKRVMTTYQNIAERWQLVLDDAWRKNISISKMNEGGVSLTTFSDYHEGGGSVPVLMIYRLTGGTRSYYASREGMIELVSTNEETFCAFIPEDASRSELALNEEEIKSRFSFIEQEWD